MPVSEWDAPPWAARPGRFRPPPAAVLLVPVVVSLLVQVPAAIGIAAWQQVGWPAGLAMVALAAVGPLALLGSRRWPGPTVAVVAAAALVDALTGPGVGPPYVALAFAIVLAVARGAVAWAVASVVVAWAAALTIGALIGVQQHPVRIALTTLLLAACFGVGAFVRVRRERIAAYRVDAARRRQTAEQAERMRIARELHDVIGHALSQINVQAGVGLHLMDRDPEQARSSLTAIRATSKDALEEVRSVLGVMRGDGEGGSADAATPLAPQAGLDDLARLVAGVGSPRLEVRLVDRLDGARPGRAAQFAAYRIAQEALTNVVRHSGARAALVEVARDGDALLLTVDDDGRGIPAPDADGRTATATSTADAAAGAGSGLLGMRERAALLGGAVEIGPSPQGGTRVAARIPWGAP
ncbi:sensor histidine kinase [Agromyces sp. MMS24-K17]|uniref:sensor histidine kinase n=1 Tax=Agromyces sp. MMS24-K17 TaxID=3372850 RepID=UPI003754AAD0